MDSNIFDNLKRIEDFEIVKSNLRNTPNSNEPDDGTIRYNGELLYFRFNHEFDSGNTYIVYKNDTPVYYFLLYCDIDGDENSPMLKYEK